MNLMTASRHLRDDFSQKSHKPAHKPRLTRAAKLKRLDIANKYEDLTGEQ